ADRIGIMKDGRIVQLSTPEEMVLNPADDYVREFTKNAPTHRILSAHAIMKPLSKNIACDKMVAASDKIGDIARQILSSDKAVYVGDENDKPIGYINKTLIIEALFAEQSEK
ncbi:MAG: ABC transporter ATP-binding protein, partial [Alphaproteobacteria bacterium]|nr:ABC transporter ATP-binding protein [Alphaproteobacteria bacterium]